MDSWRWRAWCAVLIGAVAIPAWAERPPRRKGKDVRVERTPSTGKEDVRFCTLPFMGEDKGICFGTPPAPGSEGHVFDYEGPHLGVIEAGRSEVSTRYPCHMESVHDFTYTALSGDWANNTRDRPLAFVFFGLDLRADKARMITSSDDLPRPSEIDGGEPSLGVDGDGDGTVELMVSSFQCTSVKPPRRSLGGNSVETHCLDYWTLGQGRWSRVRRDVFYSCN